MTARGCSRDANQDADGLTGMEQGLRVAGVNGRPAATGRAKPGDKLEALMPLDLLVFGPHPDDLEIGLAGTIARHVADGYAVGLCDLTAGELGSNGTPDVRRDEAAEAARVLGVAWRENLGWPDGRIDLDCIDSAVDLIRRHRPRTVAIPYAHDRHPDHVAAGEVLGVAAFRSGLRRYLRTDPAWRPEWVCSYFINDATTPSFVIDVSAHYEAKRAALACHRSQFAPPAPDAVPTRLTASSFQRLIESRDAQFGAQIGVAFAEGVLVREPVARHTLLRDSR
jgi:N-acetylglucosamine malate deacetylase 1